MIKKFTLGKLYKPLENLDWPIYFHWAEEKTEENILYDRIEDHPFVLFLGRQYNGKRKIMEYFFLDENGNIKALWGSSDKVLYEFFERML